MAALVFYSLDIPVVFQACCVNPVLLCRTYTFNKNVFLLLQECLVTSDADFKLNVLNRHHFLNNGNASEILKSIRLIIFCYFAQTFQVW